MRVPFGKKLEQKESWSIPLTVHSSIHLFNRPLINVYPEPGPILVAKDTAVDKAGTVPSLIELISWFRGEGRNTIKILNK